MIQEEDMQHSHGQDDQEELLPDWTPNVPVTVNCKLDLKPVPAIKPPIQRPEEGKGVCSS